MDCHLVLGGSPPTTKSGNVLLDGLLGAKITWAGASEPAVAAQEVFDRAWSDGRRPYLIPYGGSNAVGIVGYVEAVAEFLSQGIRVNRILLASSSGGTQAGLVLGAKLHGFDGQVLGISVDKSRDALKARVAQLANEAAELLRQAPQFNASDIHVDDRYLGGGYGVMGEAEKSAIEMFARTEGLLLDPVYTARAAGAMIDLIRKGEIRGDDKVLFWHTGGTPALFAYADRLS
jgi:1-aminocyclopropane-1-carboxylate deaminase/D-cysteine desulfhydrase-like pyridoxal-dependent ACC family enzyme